MFFILSKTLFYLCMPATWVVALAATLLISRNINTKKRISKILFVLLLIFTNPFLVNEAFLWWEVPPTPLSSIQETYEFGVVLAGVTTGEKSPNDRTYFTKGADRLTHALQLYRMGKIKKIMISGSTEFEIFGGMKTKEGHLEDVLMLCGVPQKDIILENKSRNTIENALFSAKILKENYQNPKILLITSAFHMKRSEGCFRKAEVNFDSFSTDFYSKDRQYAPSDFLPSERAFAYWGKLIHEIVGYAVYVLVGHIA